MFYRRKLLLALIEEAGGKLSSTRIQKLMFLISERQEKKAYTFVPYKFGCYSFQLMQDLNRLRATGMLTINERDGVSIWERELPGSFFSSLKPTDHTAVSSVLEEFGNHSSESLVRYTYRYFPYYAINSAIAHELLDEEELDLVDKERKKFDEAVLFTIGYEGVSLEEYVNKLIVNGVRLLCDVRKNAFSMKYGFSKRQLENACRSVGITYTHVPELGIASSKRKQLRTDMDYRILFESYEATTLSKSDAYVDHVLDLFAENERIALTCFEKSHRMCHRGCIVKRIQEKRNGEVVIKHL